MSYWIIGKQPVFEVIKSKDFLILRICVLNENYLNELKLYEHKKKVEVVNKNFFSKITEVDTPHQGFAALVQDKIEENKNLKLNNLLNFENHVCLDDVTDTRNIGAIIRSCVAFDIQSLMINKRLINSKNQSTIKASAGAIFHIKINRLSNLSSSIKFLKKNNYNIYCINKSKKSLDLKEVKFEKKNVFIFGSEGFGISANLLKQADFEIKLNTSSKMEYLNVSNAVSSFLAVKKYLKN